MVRYVMEAKEKTENLKTHCHCLSCFICNGEVWWQPLIVRVGLRVMTQTSLWQHVHGNIKHDERWTERRHAIF